MLKITDGELHNTNTTGVNSLQNGHLRDRLQLSVLNIERCPSYRESVVTENDKNGRDGTNNRCPSHGGVRLIEVSVKRELTVLRNYSIK